MAAPKKYGLILPKTKTSGSAATLRKAAPSNVFGDDSDDEHAKSAIENMIKKSSAKNMAKVQTQMMMKKALDEDANVFEYDEVYDEMKSKKEAEDIANKSVTKDKKPRYIEGLIRNAEARKKEDERRAQRKIQKERQEEKEDFGDKEAFVTAAYKKKMEEMQQEEEEAKRKEQLEDMMDVTKQKDLSGFYRHLLKQQCGEEKIPGGSVAVVKSPVEELPSVTNDNKDADVEKLSMEKDDTRQGTSSRADGGAGVTKQRKITTKIVDDNPDADSDFLESSSSSEDDEQQSNDVQKMTIGNIKGSAGRTYRKRKQTDDPEEEEQNSPKENDSHNNDSDDDDDSSSTSGSSSIADEDKKKKKTMEPVKHLEKGNDTDAQMNDPPRTKRVPKDWREMFTKRCVGDKFEAARKRYLERKAARQGISVQ